jgi:hypothetical protein
MGRHEPALILLRRIISERKAEKLAVMTVRLKMRIQSAGAVCHIRRCGDRCEHTK